MTDKFGDLLIETIELRRKLLEANINPASLRPFAISEAEFIELKDAPYLTHEHYNVIAKGCFEMNGFTFAVVPET